jgi:hypothetical protein
MQNKPNLKTANLTQASEPQGLIRIYNFVDWQKQSQNKPNSNPIQSQTKPIWVENQMNISIVLIVGYESDLGFWPKNPKAKTNPNKANFKSRNHGIFLAFAFNLLKWTLGQVRKFEYQISKYETISNDQNLSDDSQDSNDQNNKF